MLRDAQVTRITSIAFTAALKTAISPNYFTIVRSIFLQREKSPKCLTSSFMQYKKLCNKMLNWQPLLATDIDSG